MLYKNTSGLVINVQLAPNVWAISSNVNTSVTNMSGCYSVRRLAWFFYSYHIRFVVVDFFHVGHSKHLKRNKSLRAPPQHNSQSVLCLRRRRDRNRTTLPYVRWYTAFGSCGRVMWCSGCTVLLSQPAILDGTNRRDTIRRDTLFLWIVLLGFCMMKNFFICSGRQFRFVEIVGNRNTFVMRARTRQTREQCEDAQYIMMLFIDTKPTRLNSSLHHLLCRHVDRSSRAQNTIYHLMHVVCRCLVTLWYGKHPK